MQPGQMPGKLWETGLQRNTRFLAQGFPGICLAAFQRAEPAEGGLGYLGLGQSRLTFPAS